LRNFQVRLADEAHEAVKGIARRRGISIADVIREALEIYAIGITYAQQGRRLIWEDPSGGGKAELLIPGFTSVPKKSFLAVLAERGKRASQKITAADP